MVPGKFPEATLKLVVISFTLLFSYQVFCMQHTDVCIINTIKLQRISTKKQRPINRYLLLKNI